MSKELIAKISDIQSRLKAPKSQYNKFGQYAYRNQEDILEAVKPLLNEHKLVQTISDEVIAVPGGRVYIKATVTVTDGEHFVTNTAFAREPQEQKGMNEAQITGSASSYARKYALNGMYAIDDTKDADATNDHGKAAPAEQKSQANGSTQRPSEQKQAEAPKQEEKKADAPKQDDKPKSGGRFAPKGANKPAPKEEIKTESVGGADDAWN